MTKRIIALLLAAVLCLSVFAGCSKEEADAVVVPDYEKAYAKYSPDTVVMTVNGNDVTWSLFYYMLSTAVSQLDYYLGDIVWNKHCLEGTDWTFETYAMKLTMDSIKQFFALQQQAEKMELGLTDEEREMLQQTKELFKTQNLGADATEEEFEQFLQETFYLSVADYEFVTEHSMIYEKLFAECVGEKGEKVSDEEIQEFVKNAPYVTAKHILLKTVDDEGNALSDEEIAKAKTTAEDLLKQLQKITDPKKLESTFDKLMEKHSEDEGLEIFPDGYTFTTGQMYQVFEDAAFALEEYQLSDIVESEAGYHILLRIPTKRTAYVDFDYQNSTIYTVETYAVTDVYSKLIQAWMEECDVQWKPAFENITAEKIFK